jgi:predicted esterase
MGERRWLILFAILPLLAGCGSEEDEDEPRSPSIWVLPSPLESLAEDTFFDHPWPSDLRREADGSVRFEGWPNPFLKPSLRNYIESMAGVLTGFSPAASGFVRFEIALDESSLPGSPNEALDPESAVQLIDVDPTSASYGERRPLKLHFRTEPGVYWPERTLAFMPAFGRPLRPSTRYALVVTDRARGENGERLRASAALAQVLGLASADGAAITARAALEPVVESLASLGIPKRQIVQLAVFTTNDPVGPTARIRDWVLDNFSAPDVVADSWVVKDHQRGFMNVYEGIYGPSPDFQDGQIPFVSYGHGGALAFDQAGQPVLQREFPLRFALAVPDEDRCPPPAEGYPIVLYAHGTGGSYRSMLGAGDEAEALAERCMATIGIDQIFHGTRPGSGGNVETLFFNVDNPVAARANGPQSAIDVVQQARLFTETKIRVPAAVSRSGKDVHFDPSRVAFFGHSQGGLNGPMFLAVDDQARGGVLSGSGSMISITLLEKTKPVNVAALVKTVFLGLNVADAAEVNELHPAISLAQTIVDPTDPIHYVSLIVLEPRPGFVAKSVLMTEGVNADFSGDNYTPPHAIEVQAVALGLPPQEPVIHPIAELAWSGLSPVVIPPGGLSGNLAGGAASGVLAQWEASRASDGHFVIYDIPEAMAQAAGFVRNLMDDPKGRVPAP